MVEEIYKMKNELLQQVKKELAERGPERIDVNRMGEMVDMVKDLAEAEKACWEASYYRLAVEGMQKGSGYGSGGGTGSSAGYGMQSQPVRQGYSSQGYDSMGHGDIVEKLGEEYRNLGPDARMVMRNKVLTAVGAM